MAKILKSKKNKKRWVYSFFLLVILLAAAGIVLYRCPPSLQDIGRIVQSAVGKISTISAGQTPAEVVLRGAIYDRKFNELAVSYRLFALSVHPEEVNDPRKVAEALAQFTGEKPEGLEKRLKGSPRYLDLAENLDEKQAAQVQALQLKGVYCKAVETRFYPGHTAASHVLGFMGDGVGLAGVEGKYNTVLQPGTFRQSNIPDIDFQGKESLGGASTDLILTLDMDVQKQLENRFREYLAAQGAEKGMGLVIEPGSGRILALVNQPSFNPNYFWKANESNRVNRIYNHILDKELIRPILARAAAIEREGVGGAGLLPDTVAAPDYGFTSGRLDAFERQIQLYDSVFGNWESGPSAPEQPGAAPSVTGVQVGVTLASLVNGGWRITPYVVDSLYDHATAKRYSRSNDATQKSHVLDPALSVKIRRELFAKWAMEQENVVIFTADRLQLLKEKAFSNYSMQELFVGLAPAKQPRFLLLMAFEQDHLGPMPSEKSYKKTALEGLGKDLLSLFVKEQPIEGSPEKPPAKNKENLRQFFISKRLNFREATGPISEPVAIMPLVKGMSLRKGLQQLKPYKMKVRVNGSGRIITQYPLPGQPLAGVDECILTLDSK
jgi:cell division protein FtsI (penicillin-binding protein 3)